MRDPASPRVLRDDPAGAPRRGRRRRSHASLFVRVLASVLLAIASACSCSDGRSSGPPDVLVLVMDTTRADRCSFLGYERPTTPRLAQLAKDAVVFTDAWSPSSWTVPSHAALFTGLLPPRLGVVGAVPARMREDVPTLAEILEKAGFATGAFTCNAWITPHSGLSRGFATLERVFLNPLPDRTAIAHELALRWMRERRSERKPFFAFVNDVDPHLPWNPPPEFEKAFLRDGTTPAAIGRARALDDPEVVLGPLGIAPPAADVMRAASDLYDAEIASLDDAIGKLLDGMEDAGLLENTLVVILGDHGEGLGDHGWIEHGTYLHRELIRVPLLVRPPGGCAARTVPDLVRVGDVFPTVLAACGIEVPAGIDALPLLGAPETLTGRIALATERTPEVVCANIEKLAGKERTAALRVQRASVSDGWHHLLVDELGGVELYDLLADPKETRNLAAERADIVTRLRAELDDAAK